MSDNKGKKVPKGRVSRFARLTKLAGGVAGGMLAEGGRRIRSGETLNKRDLLLTPGNAKRVSDELAKMRGAAMKIGQLLSMDAGDLLPKELTDTLARLQSDAAPMPWGQLEEVLEKNYGQEWQELFYQFDDKPIAAASIGQVHRAISVDGQELALKIQYPGIAESIDADVDNVASLLKLTGLLPADLDFEPLLAVAKKQLHAEADYRQEAEYLCRYTENIGSQPYALPAHIESLSTDKILAMTFVRGQTVEAMQRLPQAVRNKAMQQLFALFMQELFDWRLMQTDPNFANYQFQTQKQQWVLLDFGACRDIPAKLSKAYLALFKAGAKNDRKKMAKAIQALGYFAGEPSDEYREAVIDIFSVVTQPLRDGGELDLASSTMVKEMHDLGQELQQRLDEWSVPPADILFIHRKIGGLYMLAARLKAKVNVSEVMAAYI